MELPFTQDAFFALFGRYNAAVWPLVILFYGFGAVAVASLFRPGRGATLFVAGVLAVMWLVNGVGYHWMFFREINPAAGIFAAVFVVQAVLLVLLPLRAPEFGFSLRPDLRSAAGVSLMLFATVLYPLWGWLAGHVWPQVPAFGVAPCPTTIFTIGVLLTGSWFVARWLLILPGLWAAVGGSAAILLSVPQDFALLGSLGFLLLFAAGRLVGSDFAQHRAG